MDTLVQDSVRQALDAYILSTGSGAVSASGGKEKLIAADVELLSDDSSDEDSDSAVLRICVSEIKLDRLVAQFKLPAELKSEKNEVHSVTDFYLHALRKYEKLRTVFEGSTDGAELILAVHRFRDLFKSYKAVGPELLDVVTVIAIAQISDSLNDKVSDSLEVACSVPMKVRRALFKEMMSSGVLPAVSCNSDILESVGAKEILSPESCALGLKSICSFIVSYCGHFSDILMKAQDAERNFTKLAYGESDDCQARFSAEQKAYNLALLWFGCDFILPLKRAQLFLFKSPTHVKKQFAEDGELGVGTTWVEFKTMMSSVWMAPVKKHRMMIEMGLVIESPSIVPDASEISNASSVNSFATSGMHSENEEMVDLECKSEGCGTFKYSAKKLLWLKDHFKEKYKVPSKCPKHKAETMNSSFLTVDVAVDGSAPEAPHVDVPVESENLNSDIPAKPKNRFGSRRSPVPSE